MTRLDALLAIVRTTFDHPHQIKIGRRVIYAKVKPGPRYQLRPRFTCVQAWKRHYQQETA
jgi:hypothetical protein